MARRPRSSRAWHFVLSAARRDTDARAVALAGTTNWGYDSDGQVGLTDKVGLTGVWMGSDKVAEVGRRALWPGKGYIARERQRLKTEGIPVSPGQCCSVYTGCLFISPTSFRNNCCQPGSHFLDIFCLLLCDTVNGWMSGDNFVFLCGLVLSFHLCLGSSLGCPLSYTHAGPS